MCRRDKESAYERDIETIGSYLVDTSEIDASEVNLGITMDEIRWREKEIRDDIEAIREELKGSAKQGAYLLGIPEHVLDIGLLDRIEEQGIDEWIYISPVNVLDMIVTFGLIDEETPNRRFTE